MSNLGQAALIVVGTVVGAYFGQPGLGFALGSLVGSALFPTQLPAGPRITDNRTTTATVGEPVPILFGTATVSGTVIDLLPYVEISSETGGKGGPEQQTFSYTQTIAIGLVERVDDNADPAIGAIQGMLRVWENGTLVYDVRPQQPADTSTGTPAETDQQYANRLTASAVYAETFVLYPGDELQDPDPTLEAYHGAGNVPGFRGLAYLVYPNRQLTIAQGLRHPNFTFELFQFGTGDCTDTTEYSNDIVEPWSVGLTDPRASNQIYTYQFTRRDGGMPTPFRSTLEDAMADAVDSGGPFTLQDRIFGWSPCANVVDAGSLEPFDTQTGFGGTGQCSTPVSSKHLPFTFIWFNRLTPVGALDFSIIDTRVVSACAHVEATPTGFWWIGEIIDSIGNPDHIPGHGIYNWPFPTDHGTFNCSGNSVVVTYDDSILATPVPGMPADPCFGLPAAPIVGYCVREDGKWIKGGSWTLDTSKTYRVLYSGEWGGSTPEAPYISYMNPCLPPEDPNYSDATFWTEAYDAAVTAGDLPSGWSYGLQYPVNQERAWTIDLQVCEGQGGSASVADIVSALCSRGGLTAIDVSDLTAIFVPGYAISSICNAADAIAPLRSIAFFDAVESGTVLRFPTRGKEIVATLTTDDFGCYDGGDGTDGSSDTSNIPPAITTVRTDQTTLPRSIRLHYKAVSRDYEDGEADSQFRLASKAIDDQDVSLPLCLGDVQAAQAAEIMWADAWAAESTHDLSVDQAWLELEVADCIGVPIKGVIQRIRIVSDSNASAVLRKLSCVRDDGGSYISFATATAPARIPQRLTFIDATADELMDLPALQDSDNDPGFYVAAQRANDVGGTWKGCTLYKSVDSGTTFQSLFSMLTEATVGTLYTEIPPSQAWTWDDETIITVDVASSAFTFESRTDEAVLNGANAAAIGADARWEIVQFANAEQISSTRWQLSRLLRGRRGTEHVIGSSRAGDALVMLSTGDLNRVILQTSEIGATRVYRATSIGASFSSGATQGFVGRGMALKPFSPVRLVAKRETGGDIVISWIRRNRLGRTLMSGVILPMSEATLAFQIDIIDPTSPASPEVVMRTLTSSSASVRYTAAEQHADFGSPLPITVKVAVYQMSAVVGRGFPATDVLTVE